MKLKRAVPFRTQDGKRACSGGYWLSADGRWRICKPYNRDGADRWEIRPVGVKDTHDPCEWQRYSADQSFLRSVGLDCGFRTRREALAALDLALAGEMACS